MNPPSSGYRDASGDGDGDGPPPNPRAGRQRYLVGALRTGAIAVGLIAVAGSLLSGAGAEWASRLLVGSLVAIPAARVGWLFLRWARLGDRRYATVAAGVLAVMVVGGALAR